MLPCVSFPPFFSLCYTYPALPLYTNHFIPPPPSSLFPPSPPVCYGAWGVFMFGSQAPGWASMSSAFLSILRFLMYDYDLDAMQDTYPVMADVFFVTFMVLMTNMMLWIFFGIILDSYSQAMSASHGAPTLWDDAAAFLRSLPPAKSLLHIATAGYAGVPYAGVDAVIEVLKVGPLAGRSGGQDGSGGGGGAFTPNPPPTGTAAAASATANDLISPAALANAVPHLTHKNARDLIVDALAWSTSAIATSGGVLPEDDGESPHPQRSFPVDVVEFLGEGDGGGSGGGAGGTGGGGGGAGAGSVGGGGNNYSQRRVAIDEGNQQG